MIASSSLATVRPATNGDLPAVERLLVDSKLPLDGVREALKDFVVAESDASSAVRALHQAFRLERASASV